MNNLTFSQTNCKEETISTWLAAVMQFGLKINFFDTLKEFKLKMKEVEFGYMSCLGTVVLERLLYRKRQIIEAFFKIAKNVYHIKNLRTTKFYSIYAFLWLVFMTHNLISYYKSDTLAHT